MANLKGDTGEQGERGKQGRSSWGEWVRWGLTMAAVILSLVSVKEISQSGAESREQIVDTGRQSIRSGCNFDNQRQRELAGGLRIFLDDHEALHNLARRFNAPIDHQNLKRIQAGIDALSIRDCDKAAEQLKGD